MTDKFPGTSCGMALAHGFLCPFELELAALRAVLDAARGIPIGVVERCVCTDCQAARALAAALDAYDALDGGSEYNAAELEEIYDDAYFHAMELEDKGGGRE